MKRLLVIHRFPIVRYGLITSSRAEVVHAIREVMSGGRYRSARLAETEGASCVRAAF
jgi:hypothetical protein